RVARYSPCPVLVTRAGPENGVVIAATDFSDPSIPAIVTGSKEAIRLGTSLVVVHAIDFALPPPVASGGFFGLVPTTYSAEAIAEMQTAAQTNLATLLKNAKVQAEPVVLAGDAADSVVSEAETRHAQLIVVGTHGRTGLAHIALGSVAENIMRNAPCSVLVVRLATPSKR
ncbi:MAG: universal stress protein, partial [Polyangiaceae bacterium]